MQHISRLCSCHQTFLRSRLLFEKAIYSLHFCKNRADFMFDHFGEKQARNQHFCSTVITHVVTILLSHLIFAECFMIMAASQSMHYHFCNVRNIIRGIASLFILNAFCTNFYLSFFFVIHLTSTQSVHANHIEYL